MCHHHQHVLVAAIALMAAFILQGVSSTTNFTGYAATTAYDVFELNNMPRGLLPLGVQSFVLDAGGALELTLPGECNFFVEVAGKQIKFRFDSSVSGAIRSGSISRLSGAWIQVEFALVGFNQVSRAGDQLNFRLEKKSTQSFPTSAFAESVPCSGLLAA